MKPFELTPVALSIPFDNSSNGYAATSVQAAIQEASLHLATSDVTATSDTTTTSGTNVLMNSMTATPEAGTYFVWFSTALRCSSSGASVFVSIYAGGSQVDASEREAVPFPAGLALGGASTAVPITIQCKVTVNGSQAIEARWRRASSGTATAHQRSMTLLRLA